MRNVKSVVFTEHDILKECVMFAFVPSLFIVHGNHKRWIPKHLACNLLNFGHSEWYPPLFYHNGYFSICIEMVLGLLLRHFR